MDIEIRQATGLVDLVIDGKLAATALRGYKTHGHNYAGWKITVALELEATNRAGSLADSTAIYATKPQVIARLRRFGEELAAVGQRNAQAGIPAATDPEPVVVDHGPGRADNEHGVPLRVLVGALYHDGHAEEDGDGEPVGAWRLCGYAVNFDLGEADEAAAQEWATDVITRPGESVTGWVRHRDGYGDWWVPVYAPARGSAEAALAMVPPVDTVTVTSGVTAVTVTAAAPAGRVLAHQSVTRDVVTVPVTPRQGPATPTVTAAPVVSTAVTGEPGSAVAVGAYSGLHVQVLPIAGWAVEMLDCDAEPGGDMWILLEEGQQAVPAATEAALEELLEELARVWAGPEVIRVSAHVPVGSPAPVVAWRIARPLRPGEVWATA